VGRARNEDAAAGEREHGIPYRRIDFLLLPHLDFGAPRGLCNGHYLKCRTTRLTGWSFPCNG
jgi:hypothetical protein